MFGAMKATVAAQRALDHAAAEAAGTVVAELSPTCREVVEFATIEGARTTGLDHKVGSLTPGKDADVIVVRTDDPGMLPVNNPYGALVYNAHPGVVDTVLVRGRPVKRHGRIVSVDMAHVTRLAYESREHLFAAAAADPAIPGARPGGDWMPRQLHAEAV
jgi:cytosine/adenosine deaminase-related metal-dependent hydrolase